MQSHNTTTPRRWPHGRLSILVLAAASVLLARVVVAQTAPEGDVAPALTRAVYCAGAAQDAVICDPPGLLITADTGTITIQVTNHAYGGEACVITDYNEDPITNTLFINPGDNHPKTFYNKVPGGTWFYLQCMRRSPVPGSDAGIGGWIYFSGIAAAPAP
jgi:hypothetical protein